MKSTHQYKYACLFNDENSRTKCSYNENCDSIPRNDVWINMFCNRNMRTQSVCTDWSKNALTLNLVTA